MDYLPNINAHITNTKKTATLAAAFILPKSNALTASRRRKQAIALLTMSAAVLRSELAILLGTTGLYLLFSRQASLMDMIFVFLTSFLGSLAMSVPIDSYFWQKWLWPEFAGFYYNAILGSSSAWGVSPWHYYFTSALPRLFLNPLVPCLLIFALYQPGISRQARQLTVPSLLFTIIYSLQPHKEARFIFYVVPPLTGAAALAANFISSRRTRSWMYTLSTYALGLSIPFTLALSSFSLLISALNYPGGEALVHLQRLTAEELPQLGPNQTAAIVHADVLTCMTGLTLFGNNPSGLPLAYAIPATDSGVTLDDNVPTLLLIDKTEKAKSLGSPFFWSHFDYALEENPALPLGDWHVMGVVYGFDFLRPGDADTVPANQEKKILDSADGGEDNILGLGASVLSFRRQFREYTGGWWVGPRMAPRIRIMKQIRHI